MVLATKPVDLDQVVSDALAGKELEREVALGILRYPDERLDELLEATLAVRQRYFGRRVKLCVLNNIQSGICPEDCHYCSQSKISRADIPVYKLKPVDSILAGARRAIESGAQRYCMVASMRGPNGAVIEHMAEACQRIRKEFPTLELCLSLGLMSEEQARVLKQAGAGWINHNLNTSRRFYPKICTTHTFDDRVRTVENVRRAGLSTCCGGIVGMGEEDDDIVDLAYETRRLRVDSLPVNFLHPIPGTPLEHTKLLTWQKCLKAACLFRLMNPATEIRAAGGRELNLGPHQDKVLCAVNSIFVNGYLTTPGMAYEPTVRLIEQAGFEPEVD